MLAEINMHEYNDSGICIHCGFNLKEWIETQRRNLVQQGVPQEDPQPRCIDRKTSTNP